MKCEFHVLLIVLLLFPPAASADPNSSDSNNTAQPTVSQQVFGRQFRTLPEFKIDSFVLSPLGDNEEERRLYTDIYNHNQQDCGTLQLAKTTACFDNLKTARKLVTQKHYGTALLFFDRATFQVPGYEPIRKERADCYEKLGRTPEQELERTK